MATKVKAIGTVFHAGRRYRDGDEFILAEGYKPGKSMVDLGEVAAPPKAKEPKAKEPKAKKEPTKEPETFSELAKAAAPKSPKDSV